MPRSGSSLSALPRLQSSLYDISSMSHSLKPDPLSNVSDEPSTDKQGLKRKDAQSPLEPSNHSYSNPAIPLATAPALPLKATPKPSSSPTSEKRKAEEWIKKARAVSYPAESNFKMSRHCKVRTDPEGRDILRRTECDAHDKPRFYLASNPSSETSTASAVTKEPAKSCTAKCTCSSAALDFARSEESDSLDGETEDNRASQLNSRQRIRLAKARMPPSYMTEMDMELLATVANAFHAVDPLGLLADGAPSDEWAHEYPELSALATFCRPATLTELHQLVHDYMIFQFGYSVIGGLIPTDTHVDNLLETPSSSLAQLIWPVLKKIVSRSPAQPGRILTTCDNCILATRIQTTARIRRYRDRHRLSDETTLTDECFNPVWTGLTDLSYPTPRTPHQLLLSMSKHLKDPKAHQCFGTDVGSNPAGQRCPNLVPRNYAFCQDQCLHTRNDDDRAKRHMWQKHCAPLRPTPRFQGTNNGFTKPFTDWQGRRCAAKLCLYNMDTPNRPMIWCWQRRDHPNCTSLDLPGGLRDWGDNNSQSTHVDTLLREVDEELILPKSLAVRIQSMCHFVANTKTAVCTRPVSLQTHEVTVWFIPASALELANIFQTDAGKREGSFPQLRPLAEFLRTTPYQAAMTAMDMYKKPCAHDISGDSLERELQVAPQPRQVSLIIADRCRIFMLRKPAILPGPNQTSQYVFPSSLPSTFETPIGSHHAAMKAFSDQIGEYPTSFDDPTKYVVSRHSTTDTIYYVVTPKLGLASLVKFFQRVMSKRSAYSSKLLPDALLVPWKSLPCVCPKICPDTYSALQHTAKYVFKYQLPNGSQINSTDDKIKWLDGRLYGHLIIPDPCPKHRRSGSPTYECPPSHLCYSPQLVGSTTLTSLKHDLPTSCDETVSESPVIDRTASIAASISPRDRDETLQPRANFIDSVVSKIHREDNDTDEDMPKCVEANSDTDEDDAVKHGSRSFPRETTRSFSQSSSSNKVRGSLASMKATMKEVVSSYWETDVHPRCRPMDALTKCVTHLPGTSRFSAIRLKHADNSGRVATMHTRRLLRAWWSLSSRMSDPVTVIVYRINCPVGITATVQILAQSKGNSLTIPSTMRQKANRATSKRSQIRSILTKYYAGSAGYYASLQAQIPKATPITVNGATCFALRASDKVAPPITPQDGEWYWTHHAHLETMGLPSSQVRASIIEAVAQASTETLTLMNRRAFKSNAKSSMAVHLTKDPFKAREDYLQEDSHRNRRTVSQPCAAIKLTPQATKTAAAEYAKIHHPKVDNLSGTDRVNFNEELLQRLVNDSQQRARARGALQVTPRDVSEAAQLIAEAKRTPIKPSPAAEHPQHMGWLQEQLRIVHEAVSMCKVRGSRVPKVLLVGEVEGVTATAFHQAGADVVTCDLEPRRGGPSSVPHFQGDAKWIQDLGWDLVIAHPPCIYLSNAGVQYLHSEEGRWDRMYEAATVFLRLKSAKAAFVCVEQPKMHCYARDAIGGNRPAQYIHPWQHGLGHSKPLGLFLSNGLPLILPTCTVPGREKALANIPPGPRRSAMRSHTYIGVACAMAIQWMPFLMEHISQESPSQVSPDALAMWRTAGETRFLHDEQLNIITTITTTEQQAEVADLQAQNEARGHIPPVIESPNSLGSGTSHPKPNLRKAPAPSCGRNIYPRPVASIHSTTDARPWLWDSTLDCVPHLRTDSLKLRKGKWSSLVGQGPHPPASYEWKALPQPIHEAIELQLDQAFDHDISESGDSYKEDSPDRLAHIPAIGETADTPQTVATASPAIGNMIQHYCGQAACEPTWQNSAQLLNTLYLYQLRQGRVACEDYDESKDRVLVTKQGRSSLHSTRNNKPFPASDNLWDYHNGETHKSWQPMTPDPDMTRRQSKGPKEAENIPATLKTSPGLRCKDELMPMHSTPIISIESCRASWPSYFVASTNTSEPTGAGEVESCNNVSKNATERAAKLAWPNYSKPAALLDTSSGKSPIARVSLSKGLGHDTKLKGGFHESDIVSPPPPLPFTPTCAYISDFAIACNSSARKQEDEFFLVGNAACNISDALQDSGAGPSVLGSDLINQLPNNACLKWITRSAEVGDDLVGADGNPLVILGTVVVLFTMSGYPFRHPFTVIQGGNLLLIGNDFTALYEATITLTKDHSFLGLLACQHGHSKYVQVDLSCDSRPNNAVLAVQTRKAFLNTAAVLIPRARPIASVSPLDMSTLLPTHDHADMSQEKEILDGAEALHPALVALDYFDQEGTGKDEADNSPGANDATTHVHTQMMTDEHLLYCEQPLKIDARSTATIWLRSPRALLTADQELMVNRLPDTCGLDKHLFVVPSIDTPDKEGLIPVRIVNSAKRSITIAASSPIAKCTFDHEVQIEGALDPESDQAYDRLSKTQRDTLQKVSIDPDNRLSNAQHKRVLNLLATHIRAFAVDPKDPTRTHLLTVHLPLKEGAIPHRHAASRVGDQGQKIIDAQCAEMEANGIIRKSNSAWGSRVVLVKKRDGSVRFCIDFRDTNRKLVTLDSPIPRCDEALDRFSSGKGRQDSLFISTLDLAAGFWTLPIKEEDKPVTAFVTHRQKYEWNVCPFGIASGPSYMCRLMDAALKGLAWDICIPYLDDCGVHSTGHGETPEEREANSFDQMMERLDLVLQRFVWAGLSAKASKCVLFAIKTAYLGHVISRTGLEMDPFKLDKVKTIDPKSLNTIERVRSFMGLCSYYRRFVKDFAGISSPLTDLTKTGVDVATQSQTPAAQQAAITLIEALTSEPVVLRMPKYDRPFIVKTDAAATEGIGGVLSQQDDDGNEKVVAYYGRRLSDAERKYTVSEIELLAAKECMKTWRPYLWGRHFKLIIDHAALKWLHSMKDSIEGGPATRLMRWTMKLQEYDFEVEHKAGKLHADADAVSRLVAAVTQTANGQSAEEDLQQMDPQQITPQPTEISEADTSSTSKEWGAAPPTPFEYCSTCETEAPPQAASRCNTCGSVSEAPHRFFNTMSTNEAITHLRCAYANWSQQISASPEQISVVRQAVTNAAFGDANGPIELPTKRLAAAIPRTSRAKKPSADARSAVDTAKTLHVTDRLQRSLEATRHKVQCSYVQVGTPTTNALRLAQSTDKLCGEFREYMSTGEIQDIPDSLALKRASWIKRESKHLVILDTGVIARVDPVSSTIRTNVDLPPSCPKPLIPAELQQAYINAFHDCLGHQGKHATMRLLRRRYYWPGMYEDVQVHVQQCHECTLARTYGPDQITHPCRPTVGSYPFDSVICDIKYMGLTTDGTYDKILVFADSLSRWIEVVPFLGEPNGEEVLNAYLTHVACRYGFPREIRTDGGSNLANTLSAAIHKLTGVELRAGVPYHSQSQGVAERVQGTLQRMCRASNEGMGCWHQHLPFMIFAYHAASHSSTGLSPALIVLGHELRLPSQMSDSSPTEIPDMPKDISAYATRTMLLLQSAWKAARSATVESQEYTFRKACGKGQSNNKSFEYEVGDRVCHQIHKANKSDYSWSLPCRVKEVMGNGNYRLSDLANNMMDDTFNICRLRAYRVPVDTEELTPDEYIVDRILEHRTELRPNGASPSNVASHYRVKWRQFPKSKATWEPRHELMRRCDDMVESYDKVHHLGITRTTVTVPRSPSPQPTEEPSPATVDTPTLESDDLPHKAILQQNNWVYIRRIATPRGLQDRHYQVSAFTPSELATPHFTQLRDSFIKAQPTPRARRLVVAVCTHYNIKANPLHTSSARQRIHGDEVGN